MTVVMWLGAVAGCVTSVGIIWRGLIRPVIRWGTRLDKTMSFVEAQMLPNGGSSLRDALNRIESRITIVEDFVTRPK